MKRTYSLKKKHVAFTLAETLITLGIIAVVAAMTIPTVIINNQKQVTAKRLEQTYSILSQAISHAQADYGDISSWGIVFAEKDFNNSEQRQKLITTFAEKYLIPYLKTSSKPVYSTSIKNNGYVFPKTKDGETYFITGAYLIELANGVILFVSYNGDEAVFTTPLIFVDINAKQNPNIVGRDWFLFSFNVTNRMRLLPYGAGLDRETLKKYCSRHSGGHVSENFYCTALIVNDGWEIKDDYPW